MQIGSLVERILIPGDESHRINGGIWKTGFPARYPIVPLNTPVVVKDFKFAPKWDRQMFYISIDGYHEFHDADGSIHVIWYGYDQFRELQPPMDMKFIEKIQLQYVNQLTR